eukprot:6200197-Pleurochrysis_carterae.AAC.1
MICRVGVRANLAGACVSDASQGLRTHTPTSARPLAHAHTPTLTHPRSHTHAHNPHTHTPTLARARTLAALTPTRAHARACCARWRARTHARAGARACIHTHALSGAGAHARARTSRVCRRACARRLETRTRSPRCAQAHIFQPCHVFWNKKQFRYPLSCFAQALPALVFGAERSRS